MKKKSSASSSSSMSLQQSSLEFFELSSTASETLKGQKYKTSRIRALRRVNSEGTLQQALENRTYRLANTSPKSDAKVFICFPYLVKKAESQMNAHCFDPKEATSIVDAQATLKLSCITNKIPQGGNMWVLPHYVQETLASAINSRTCDENRISQKIALVRDDETR